VSHFRERRNALEWSARQETLRIEPWGPDAVRVRATIGPVLDGLPGALMDPPESPDARIKIENGSARLFNGAITVEIGQDPEASQHQAKLRFADAVTGEELLAEEPLHFWWPGPRLFSPTGNGYHRLEQRFRAYPGERLFGLGQHTHGLLDQKGAVLDLVQRNAEVSIPFLLSSRGYGLLWNNPAIGRVELAATGTRWVCDSARQIDYWITAGQPADILRRYADVTGHAPMLPAWASGFWQCKLRYRTQAELLEVAREYARRGLPLSVIVCDYFHWTHLGDWKFDPAQWPDPAAMVAELGSLGVKLAVSVWPSVSPLSENYAEMAERGLMIGTEHGPLAHANWPDKGVAADVGVAFYDATNPEARSFIWRRVRDNYLRPWNRRLVARRLRAGAAAGVPGKPALSRWTRARGRQHLPPAARPCLPRGHARRGPDRGAQPGPVRMGGQPAVWRGPVVRRHRRRLRQLARTAQGWIECRGKRAAVVDDRHRRLSRRRPR